MRLMQISIVQTTDADSLHASKTASAASSRGVMVHSNGIGSLKNDSQLVPLGVTVVEPMKSLQCSRWLEHSPNVLPIMLGLLQRFDSSNDVEHAHKSCAHDERSIVRNMLSGTDPTSETEQKTPWICIWNWFEETLRVK